ncbi:TlpA family protein disulfide reductase [Flavobacterium selenitireducens]|uniref:TlpA family protein disulfide reductase n=1 Tax=Flavobacterium selenitireducens TaxID=2722704 RepID=UPI00168B8EB1|nr:thioredoxin-like domain-containing protein [Flavobacterium selenitireducens]MBD3583411.1 hypothetical protein [Flavobacterium selenitireducens]
MRKLLFASTFWFLLAGCSKSKPLLAEAQTAKPLPTQISLRLVGYDKSLHKSFIDLKIENRILPIVTQLKISDSGHINFNFLSDRKREIQFRYVSMDFNMILSPGENLVAEINIDELLNRHLQTVRVQGDNNKTNELLLRHVQYFEDLSREQQAFFGQNHTSDNDFKQGRLKEMEIQLRSFSNLLRNQKINDEQFRNWGTCKIKNAAGSDIATYQHLDGIKLKGPDDEYFDFIEDFESDASTVYFSRLGYLNALTSSLEIAVNVSHTYKERRRDNKDARLEYVYFPLLLEVLKNLSENRDREIMIAYAFQGKPKTIKAYKDELEELVSPDLVALLKDAKRLSTEPILQLLAKYDIPKTEKDGLLALYADTQGKVVFHDFWSKGCKPCVEEFGHYNKFIGHFNSDVVFIFLGTNMSQTEWQLATKKFDLKGKHHLLTENQFAFYQEFRVSHYPWHSLLDKSGRLSAEPIPHVFPENFSQIKGQIAKVKAMAPASKWEN